MGKYYFSKELSIDFDYAIQLVKENLSKIGFGVVSEIDVTNTFKNKLNLDFRKYRILGACHPQTAFKALSVENKIGTMLPCNIIVQELDNGNIEVAAIDPIESMKAVENAELYPLALEIQNILKDFIENKI
jgi:uncharacterized protein (DUF302 family)